MADLISYCLCCCLTPLLQNCTVQGMSWREWQEAKERKREIREAEESACYSVLSTGTPRDPVHQAKLDTTNKAAKLKKKNVKVKVKPKAPKVIKTLIRRK